MQEVAGIIASSIAQQKGSHLASVATVSAGVGAKLVIPENVTLMDQIVSAFGMVAVIIAPMFTLFLFYKAWRSDRREQKASIDRAESERLDQNLKRLLIAKESRRKDDDFKPKTKAGL